MMATEILTIRGESDGTSVTGDFPLFSDLLYHDTAPFTSPTKVIIPFGMKVKIWAKRFAAEGETLFQIFWSKDATADTPAWELLDAQKLASKGELSLEKRRPIVIRSLTGKEGFKVSWLQPVGAPAKAFVDLEVEITDEE
jgi:hypothetical protein